MVVYVIMSHIWISVPFIGQGTKDKGQQTRDKGQGTRDGQNIRDKG